MESWLLHCSSLSLSLSDIKQGQSLHLLHLREKREEEKESWKDLSLSYNFHFILREQIIKIN